ncbi:MAG: right-handed parallel beta-helix repeat-containing protein, partial [Paludibacteraceae bacterium]
MKFFLFILFFSIFINVGSFGKTYYVAVNGNDTTGVGSLSAPYATIMKAQQFVVAGDTVFVRGGTYHLKNENITQHITLGPYACVNFLNKSGTAANKIYYWAYPGEKPLFDFSAVKPSGYRVTAFLSTGSYLHIKGFEVIGVQVTILTHTQSECFRNQGSNNTFEQLSMHDGMAIGFYQQNGSNNLVLNCDAYRNWDNVSENLKGGNVDGFGFHPGKGYTGNRIYGCRAWFNSDDGYDCINAYEPILFENCWSFYNGYNSSFTSLGDGNGFKVGGYGSAPVVSGLPNPVPADTARFCLAYRNRTNGFYANHHVETGHLFYNNSAYRNTVNYNMLSQKITKSALTGKDTTIDCPGIRHMLHNNLSFKYSGLRDTINIGTSTNTYNTFSPNSGVIVNGADFLSIYESELVSPRNADGSLPDINFMKLSSTSDLIDKGMNLGFPFSGAAPDLGAFEFRAQTAVESVPENRTAFFPNPVKNKLTFTD